MLSIIICKIGKDITIKETPNTARVIKKVSHNPAVIITGNVCINRFWFAPWLNTKIFCAPKGKIRPRANKKPCKIDCDIVDSLSYYWLSKINNISVINKCYMFKWV